MTGSAPAIRVTGLVKNYGRVQALRGLDFEMPSGQVSGFVGPNGAGKTTTFRSLLGLTRLNSGSVEVLGLPVPGRLGEIAPRVGAIVEEPGLIRALSGNVNMQVAADTLGFGHDAIPSLIDFVGLTADVDRKVSGYSKGMRQRLALAAALIGDPELLLLDEPLDGLDPAGQVMFRKRLQELAAERKTVVVSSHDMADIESLAEYIVVINKGKLVSQGPLEELLDGGGTRVEISEVARAFEVLESAGFAVSSDDKGLLVGSDDRESIIKALGEAGLYPREVTQDRSSLESVFLGITGEESE